MDIVQEYLKLYDELTDAHKSISANKAILQIEKSQQSWVLAKEMLKLPNNHKGYSHGCQLLSRKLNRPYTKQKENVLNLLQFIYSLTLNQTLYLCLAKLHLHLDLQFISIPQPLSNPFILINILAFIPESSKIISTAPITEITQTGQRIKSNREYHLAMQYFESYKHLLIEYFDSYSQLIIKCIDSFIMSNYSIKDQSILRLVLTQNIENVAPIIESFLEKNSYPQLNEQIYDYLVRAGLNDSNKTVEELQQIIRIYSCFCRNLDLLSLNEQLLFQVLSKNIEFMRRQLQENETGDYATIQNTFEFWSHVVGIIRTAEKTEQSPQIDICYKALIEIWKLVIQKSLLSTLPEFQREQIDPLVISLDDDDGDDDLVIQAKVQFSGKFRNIAEDFILLIYNNLAGHPGYRKEILQSIYDLTQSGYPVYLQLSIFVISCIIQNAKSEAVLEIGAVIQSIISHEHAKIPYIWQQLIKLMSKFGTQTTSNIKILKLTLLVLKQSLFIPELCVLASQTFNNIISLNEYSSNKQQIALEFEELISYIYESIYLKLVFPPTIFMKEEKKATQSSQKAFDNLTKGIMFFIYHFKKNNDYYVQFLLSLQQKMSLINGQQSIIDSRKIQILSELALAHTFVKEEESRPFTSTLSEFIRQYTNLLKNSVIGLANDEYSKNRQKHKKIMMKLSMIIEAVGGYHSDHWGAIISEIVNHAFQITVKKQEQWNKIRYRYINLCNNFIKIQNHNGQQYYQTIYKFHSVMGTTISAVLQKSGDKQYELILSCLNYHFEILKNHVERIKNYNPQYLLLFIKNRIIENLSFWEYSIFRCSLAMLRIFVEKNYEVQLILDMIFCHYQRLADCFWKSIEAIVLQAYKVKGIQVFKNVLSHRKQKLLPPNPLFDSFSCALTNSDTKVIKMFLQNLK